jgi:molecular chaperone Hsp33
MGALLVASYCKKGERINLNIQGSGHYSQALVDAHPDGSVRGYVIERKVRDEDLEIFAREGIGPWGTGLLSVLRTKGDEGAQPYIGTVPLLTGHLAKDLSFYWAQSEQIPSAVGLVVNLDEHNEVQAAGGFLIQILPGASKEEVQTIERHINDIHSLEEALSQDQDPLHLLSRIFQSTSFMIVEEKPVEFRCNCSWERVERALTLVGAKELRSMLAENGEAIVHCDFCCKEYKVDTAHLERLIAATQP